MCIIWNSEKDQILSGMCLKRLITTTRDSSFEVICLKRLITTTGDSSFEVSFSCWVKMVGIENHLDEPTTDGLEIMKSMIIWKASLNPSFLYMCTRNTRQDDSIYFCVTIEIHRIIFQRKVVHLLYSYSTLNCVLFSQIEKWSCP